MTALAGFSDMLQPTSMGNLTTAHKNKVSELKSLPTANELNMCALKMMHHNNLSKVRLQYSKIHLSLV